MLVAALRRLAGLVGFTAAVTAAGSLALGALAGASLARSLSVGFYAVGAFLLIAGFFIGNRGPVRLRSESPGSGFTLFPLFGVRRLGWATQAEQQEAISYSAVFIVLGFVFVLLGVAFDSGHRLW
jgi:hypothetical protein